MTAKSRPSQNSYPCLRSVPAAVGEDLAGSVAGFDGGFVGVGVERFLDEPEGCGRLAHGLGGGGEVELGDEFVGCGTVGDVSGPLAEVGVVVGEGVNADEVGGVDDGAGEVLGQAGVDHPGSSEAP